MVGRIVRTGPATAVRWGAALGLGAAWWWAVLRLALGEGAGVLEGAVAVGGWGLSVLPVHCVPKDGGPKDRVPKDGGRRGGATGVLPIGRWSVLRRATHVTRASRHPRSGEGSAPS
ncbi:hypothetical protein [Streptomyces sp. NPDC096012]|uniref:hypothetical protein n=1 Tax=Streptomyces sp. NPDC096012 TaxID=3155684 RepID=UPI00336A5CBF